MNGARSSAKICVVWLSPLNAPWDSLADDYNRDFEGSVLQAGDRVRVTAQLIDARTDRHVWAQSY